MSEIKKYQNWPGLEEYTKEFKEWIWKLFRKIHARIGHVEEELAHVRDAVASDYLLEGKGLVDGKYEYVLYDRVHPDQYHGKISIDISTGIHTVNWYDGEMQTAEFTKVYRWEGNRGDWSTYINNRWQNCLVFGKIHEADGNITKCIWAGNDAYSYEMGAVYWDEPEFEGSERP